MPANPEQTAAHPSGSEAVALKPCPQCGEIPERTKFSGVFIVQHVTQTHRFQAYGKTPEMADAAWNARPLSTRQPDQVALLVAGLEKIADESWVHDQRNKGGVAMYAAMILAAFHGGGNVDG